MPGSNLWIFPPPKAGPLRLRLFCFPYAGAGAGVYQAWRPLLSPHIEVCAVQLPGRENRLGEAPVSDLGVLVGMTASAIGPYLTGPFALFGHSMGALLAFELTRRLRREQGPLPVRLFVSGCKAPQLPRSSGPLRHDLQPEDLIAELARFEGTPPEILANPDLLDLLLPILRADFAAVETYAYTPETPLDCPITALGGAEDPEVSHTDLSAWAEQTHGTFNLYQFAGGHFFLRTAREDVLQALKTDLQAPVSSAAPGQAAP